MEYGEYLRFLLALIVVLGLIGLCARLGKRVGLVPRARKQAHDTARLSIVEVRPVDGKRKLILIERDAVQHLLLVGAEHDLLIETGIERPPQADAPDGTSPSGPPHILPFLRRDTP